MEALSGPAWIMPSMINVWDVSVDVPGVLRWWRRRRKLGTDDHHLVDLRHHRWRRRRCHWLSHHRCQLLSPWIRVFPLEEPEDLESNC